MFNRLVLVLVFLPLAIILIALAVAEPGHHSLHPRPVLSRQSGAHHQVPLFFLLFAALAIGLVVGGAATWLRQGQYRKLARQRGLEAQAARDAAARDRARGPWSETSCQGRVHDGRAVED